MTSTHEQWDILTSVGITALAVAAARAIETARADPLITDEFAAKFVAAAQPRQPMPTAESELDNKTADRGEHAAMAWQLMSDYMALRTRFLDDFLLANPTGQVVILAAGLDARAFRLDWPADCLLWEIDQPKVLEFKQQVLDETGARPRCTRRLVPTDLREDWVSALLAAGFDRSRPTAWLAEGLLPYLPGRAEEDLFGQLHALSAPGSSIAAENLDHDAVADLAQHPIMQAAGTEVGVDMNALWHSEPRRDCVEWLRWAGWSTTVTSTAELEDQHHRRLGDLARPIFGRATMLTAHQPG